MLWLSEVTLKQDITHHHHDIHEFVVCLSGEVNINIEGQTYCLNSGNAFFLPANLAHSIHINKEKQNHLLFTCIDPASLENLFTPANSTYLKKLPQGNALASISKHNTHEMLEVSKHIIKLIDDSSPFQMCIKENLFLRLLLLYVSDAGSETKTNDLATQRINGAKAWIDKHYTEEISLERVANQVNMSRSHFARQFRQHTGFSVIDYLLKVRCDAVAAQLAHSTTDISEIAFATGFSNLSHFYRHFKRRYGATPRAFRQMIRNQGIALQAS